LPSAIADARTPSAIAQAKTPSHDSGGEVYDESTPSILPASALGLPTSVC